MLWTILVLVQLLSLLLLLFPGLPEGVHAAILSVLHYIRQGILGTQVLVGPLLGSLLGGGGLLKDGPLL